MRIRNLLAVSRLSVGGAALVVCGGAAASPAMAATASVGRACYVNANPSVGAPIQVSGSGFAPGHQLEVEGQGVFGTTTAGSTGGFAVTVQGPILATSAPAAKRFELRVLDETDGSASATTTVRMANLSFRTKPGVAKPSARVRYHFSGFRKGRAIYGHFVHKGRVITHRYGEAKGACGMLTTRATLFPGGHPRHTHYKVQFDDSRRFHTKATPRITTSISIRIF
jgi:hypothetical protein